MYQDEKREGHGNRGTAGRRHGRIAARQIQGDLQAPCDQSKRRRRKAVDAHTPSPRQVTSWHSDTGTTVRFLGMSSYACLVVPTLNGENTFFTANTVEGVEMGGLIYAAGQMASPYRGSSSMIDVIIS